MSKNDRFVSIRCVFLSSKCTKTRLRHSPDPLVGWGGEPYPSRRRRDLGAGCQAPEHKFLATPMVLNMQTYVVMSLRYRCPSLNCDLFSSVD